MKLGIKLQLLGWPALCLLSLSSCNDTLQEDTPTALNTPLIISAEIESGQTGGATTRVATDNGYDRSTFVTGDKINVICSRSGGRLASAGYSLAAGGSWEANEGSALGFLPAITCRAEYPVDYDNVMADQTTVAAFLKSNLLRTKEVAVTGAEVKFTGDNAFEHQHAKVTLTFEGVNALSTFKQINLSGTGICSGTSKLENITPLCPDKAVYSWCAVLNASLSGNPNLKVTVVDANNITYHSNTILSTVGKNQHYKFTISLKNDILYPVGMEIEPWNTENRYTGGFD